MQLHQLKSNKKKRKRVGRGGKRGTYAGRGLKGQKSRAGRKPRVGFAGGDTIAIKRFPKRRGLAGRSNDKRIRKGVKLNRYKIKRVVLNLENINKKFKKGETVSPKSLLEKGLISRINNRIPAVKILGKGKLSKGVVFEGVEFSKNAQKNIK